MNRLERLINLYSKITHGAKEHPSGARSKDEAKPVSRTKGKY